MRPEQEPVRLLDAHLPFHTKALRTLEDSEKSLLEEGKELCIADTMLGTRMTVDEYISCRTEAKKTIDTLIKEADAAKTIMLE